MTVHRATVNLRSYRDEDWVDVSRIYDLAKPDELRHAIDTSSIQPLRSDPRMIVLFKESEIVIAEECEKVVGFGGRRKDQIVWLFVHPDCRGRGIATQLLAQLLDGCDTPIYLNVAKGNSPAITLYQRAGFEVQAEFQGDFNGQPCDVLRMRYDGHEKAERCR